MSEFMQYQKEKKSKVFFYPLFTPRFVVLLMNIQHPADGND